ncbi:hypothetical protein HMN09_00737300 [Mycena chlorophos]|uniref:DUF7918 domain-containing protein n=1 Tax=Mycena chlorophos TaxID=658473 RepID=A0A8H6STZ7_MYCCL|nr:hypothetical protein HMN09_00737300 [Mycena chlorophos]
MLQLNGFNAWITIDNQPVPEYQVDISADQTSVTCWVASELGKNFSVHWQNVSSPGDVAGYLRMDGQFCAGRITYTGALAQFPRPETVVRGVSDGPMLKPFVFSALETSDDDALLAGPAQPDLGLIALKITPVRSLGQQQEPNDGPWTTLSQQTVHERSKKAVTQQIGLGDAQYDPDGNKPLITVVRTGPDIVLFSWKYRPLDLLRANGIAPPAPANLKRKADADDDADDSDADADAHSPLPQGKKDSEVKPKKEFGEKKPKRIVKHETIDLTDDAEPAIKREKKKARTQTKGELNHEEGLATCWIASEVGKTFSVEWDRRHYKGTVTGRVTVDGNYAGGRLLYPKKWHGARAGITQMDGSTIRPFAFASLKTTDDDAYLHDPSARDVGTIELQILPVDDVRSAARKLYDVPKAVVHERAKKAFTQNINVARVPVFPCLGFLLNLGRLTRLGEQQSSRFAPFKEVSVSGPPIATFRFQYRPLAVLRAMGLVHSWQLPQPPETTSLSLSLKRCASEEPWPELPPSPKRQACSRDSSFSSFSILAAGPANLECKVELEGSDAEAEADEELQVLNARVAALEAARALRKNAVGSAQAGGVSKTEITEEEGPPMRASAVKVEVMDGFCKRDSEARDVKPIFLDLTLD